MDQLIKVIGISFCQFASLMDGDSSQTHALVGLIPKRERATLDAFIDAFIIGRTDVKQRAKMRYETTRKRLVKFFGLDAP